MKHIRMLGATAVLLLVGGMMAGGAQAQGHGKEGQKQQQPKQGKGHEKEKQQPQVAKGLQRSQAVQQQAQVRQAQRQQVVTQQQQQKRIEQQRGQETQYRAALDRQVGLGQKHAAQLERQNRKAQIVAQQHYLIALRQQQQRMRVTYDHARDPVISAQPAYRYRRAGTTYETTRYGADALRQAVSYGYQQGFLAGQADRQDRWASNYRNSYAYQDANYGYDGRYVSQADYNYYFREGVRRGYLDAFGTQPQYGTVSGGSPSILGTVLSAILGLIPVS